MKLSKIIYLLAVCVSLSFAQNATVIPVKAEESQPIVLKKTIGHEEVLDMNFVTTDLRTAFQAIGQKAGVDILLDQRVQGRITVQIHNKTWQEAVDIICNLNGLKYLVEKRYIRILLKEDFQKQQIDDAAKDKTFDDIAPRVERIFYLKNAKAADLLPIASSFKSTLGNIVAIERNNALVAYDNEQHLARIDSIVRALDVETKQVIISSKLIQAQSDVLRELGVNWNGTASGIGNTPITSGVVTPNTGTAATNGTVGVSSAPYQSPSLAASSVSFGLLRGQLGVTLNSLLNSTKSELVASPQITTLDHLKAEVFMGEKRLVRVIDDKGVSANQSVEAGVRLTVTPHITGDNRILLELKPENNNFTFDPMNNLVIQEQTAETKVVVDNGETVVIAGLTSNQVADVEIGVPVLKDIPVIGYLFKYTKKEMIKKDLIVFVTPQIADEIKKMDSEKVQTDNK